ncbi:MAG TPA: hypothetical protein VK604_15995 [Bryobacteraceae bacterium]|nr:hypothetical protein [Bryobacteraceae bacterium]
MDEYLLDAGQVELAIKRRGGQAGVEIKGLVSRIARPIQFGNLIAQGQLWTKWTTESLSLDGMSTVKVCKTRWLRKFEVRDTLLREIHLGEEESPVSPAEELAPEGCNLELTELSLSPNGPKSSTLGFESFGSHESVEANLRRLIEHLARTDIPKFQKGEELSYPAWLARVSSIAIGRAI